MTTKKPLLRVAGVLAGGCGLAAGAYAAHAAVSWYRYGHAPAPVERQVRDLSTLIAANGSDSLDGGTGDDLLDTRSSAVSIANATRTEGNSGLTNMVFTVTFLGQTPIPVPGTRLRSSSPR